MYTKIQKYLLLNHPLLWNTKVVPMGLTVIGLNLLFFILGYFWGVIDFNNFDYYYHVNDSNVIFGLITGLTSVLILIVWLIYYLKNNAFKSFYPKKSFSLYIEWGIIFILLSGDVFYFFSYTQGTQCRARTYASEKEVEKIQNTLTMANVLLPRPESYYTGIEEIAPTSLLEPNISPEPKNVQKVITWLKNDNQDSIRALMSQYIVLIKKHNLQTNLTADSWMKLVYNPPGFPISPSNYIYKSKGSIGQHPVPFVEHRKLSGGYKYIFKAYNFCEQSEGIALVSLYISLSLSILLFSFRVTSGKSWLAGIVCAGLLGFINGILAVILEIMNTEGDTILTFTIVYWSLLFFGSGIYLLNKIWQKDSKGKSRVIFNLFLWVSPYMLLIWIVRYLEHEDKTLHVHTPIYKFFDDNPMALFWINLIFVILILFFFMKILKKWRALPEE